MSKGGGLEIRVSPPEGGVGNKGFSSRACLGSSRVGRQKKKPLISQWRGKGKTPNFAGGRKPEFLGPRAAAFPEHTREFCGSVSCEASGLHFTNRLLAAVQKLSGAGKVCDIITIDFGTRRDCCAFPTGNKLKPVSPAKLGQDCQD